MIYGAGTIIIIGLVIYLLVKDNFDSQHVEGVLIGVSNFLYLIILNKWTFIGCHFIGFWFSFNSKILL